jgi:ubiquinone/menaquinone biosynthesis C-methylase UbiE
MTGPHDEQIREQHLAITRYYRFHARIYDLTRWSFLRGRETLMRRVAARFSPTRILEVGCGTGKNLLYLGRRFPQAKLWGLDLSADMLSVAQRKLHNLLPRLTLIHAAYDRPLAPEPQFDLVIFSYALSMFNPGWKEALTTAACDLVTGGALAVAHSLLTVIYHMLKTGSTYQELGGDYFDKLNKNRLVPYLVRRFKDLGFRVTLEAA